jgi:hypothetical protein
VSKVSSKGHYNGNISYPDHHGDQPHHAGGILGSALTRIFRLLCCLRGMSALPGKQTSVVAQLTSALCQKAILLNYFVGGDEKRLRHFEAECLGRLEVEH